MIQIIGTTNKTCKNRLIILTEFCLVARMIMYHIYIYMPCVYVHKEETTNIDEGPSIAWYNLSATHTCGSKPFRFECFPHVSLARGLPLCEMNLNCIANFYIQTTLFGDFQAAAPYCKTTGGIYMLEATH